MGAPARTWAVNSDASFAGSFLESDATKPRFSSFTLTFLTLKPTLSPGPASGSDSWCISTDFTCGGCQVIRQHITSACHAGSSVAN